MFILTSDGVGQHILGFLGFIFLALPAGSTALAGPPAQVSWSVERLEMEVPAGGSNSTVISFTIDRDIGALSIEPVSALRPFLSVSPEQVDAATAGEAIELTVSASFPPGQPGTARSGTLHVQEGERTLSRPLNVRLTAVETAGPQEFDADNLSPGEIRPVGVSEDSFNPVASGFDFVIDNARFATKGERGRIHVFHNGRMVPRDDVTVSAERIELPPILQPGRNVVEVSGADSEYRLLDQRFVFWAGPHRLRGVVVDRDGQSVPNAELTLILTEAPRVTASGRSDMAGEFEFEHLPPHVVHIEGRAEPDLFGSVPAAGDDGTTRLVLFDILPPSDVDNNDFSLGLEGWEIGDAPVFLIASDQDLFGSDLTLALEQLDAEDRAAAYREHFDSPSELTSVGASSDSDLDLVLATSGQGPQTISRTFQPDPETRAVTVRYRFITTEVPGGFCGTRYDDSFGVNIRAQVSGNVVSETNSMERPRLRGFRRGRSHRVARANSCVDAGRIRGSTYRPDGGQRRRCAIRVLSARRFGRRGDDRHYRPAPRRPDRDHRVRRKLP